MDVRRVRGRSVGIAGKMMEAKFQPGGGYTKCGGLLEDLTAEGAGQADLFAIANPKAPALLAAMDGLNSRLGRNTVILAVQGCGARSFDTNRSQKSTALMNRLGEIPVARENRQRKIGRTSCRERVRQYV